MFNYYLPKHNPYLHPGRLFLEQHDIPTSEDDIVSYTDFLREQSRAGKYPPIGLRAIHWHFGIKLAILPLPPGTHGFADHLKGIIYVRQDDEEPRQRFTQAHELIEILYCACEESSQWEDSIFCQMLPQKERLCHKGAAALLMPQDSFVNDLSYLPVSLQTASQLAQKYETSFTAAVHRMVNLCPQKCLMVVWREKSKSEDNSSKRGMTPTSLEIWWAEPSKSMSYIVSGQIISTKSIIWNTYITGQLQSGLEQLRLDNRINTFLVEAKRITFGNIVCVLSVIQPVIDPLPSSLQQK